MHNLSNGVVRLDDEKSEYEREERSTEEALLEALEALINQSPWLSRQPPVALQATSRGLAQRWQGITNREQLSAQPDEDHYLDDLMNNARSVPVDSYYNSEDAVIESEFLADFARFLMARFDKRLQEIRQAQSLLAKELARLQV